MPARDRVAEGVLGARQHQRVHVQPLELDDVTGEPPLGLVVERALDAGAVGLPAALADLCDQGHDALAHGVEEAVVERARGAGLELVQPHVVRVARRVLVARDRAHGVDDALQVRLEALPVVRGLGAVPHIGRLDGQPREVGGNLGRDVRLARAVATEHAQAGAQGLVQPLGLAEPAEKCAELVGAQKLVVGAVERGQRLAACGRALARVDGGAVEHDVGDRVAEREHAPLDVVELAKVLGGLFGLSHVRTFRCRCRRGPRGAWPPCRVTNLSVTSATWMRDTGAGLPATDGPGCRARALQAS